MQAVGILGGTFNPVHNGHLQCAQDLLDHFQLNEVRLIPCAIPAHKSTPELNGETRCYLLEQAVKTDARLVVDTLELDAAKQASTPSFTVNTLRQLRYHYGDTTAIYFAMGVDAFEHFESWHEWQEITRLCNIVVMQRPGYSATTLYSSPRKGWVKRLRTTFEGHQKAFGSVYGQSFTQVDVSSSQIRARLQQGQSVKHLVPQVVEQFFQEQQLFNLNSVKP